MTGTETAPAITPTVRSVGRVAGFWIVAGVVAVLIVVVSLLIGRSAAQGEPLATDNPAPGGSMALAAVLEQQGVRVIPTASLERTSAAAAAAGPATILLYDPTGILDEDRLEALSGMAERLVLVDPGFDQLAVLAPEVAQAGSVAGPLDDDCRLPAADKAGEISGDLVGYRVISDESDAIACFGSGDEVFSVVQTGQVTVVGAIGAFTNDQIDETGNAALVLNLLGEHNRLVWYLPSFADTDTPAPPPTPSWLIPSIALLAAAGIAVAFWRGRRLGPLVVENLPVTVRASETMLGRARLYERSGARLRALDALRVGTLQRIAKLAGLSRHASVEEIVIAAAALTGQPAPDVRRLLLEDLPGSDADLIRHSDDLTLLERDVTRAVRNS